MTFTLQNAPQNPERIGCAVSSCLTQENVCCPNFHNTSFAGNFSRQMRLPDGHFGQFRAIGPMELLRPDLNSLWPRNNIWNIDQFPLAHVTAANENQLIQTWVLKMHFDGQTAFLILVQLPPPPLTKRLPFHRRYIQMPFREWKSFQFWWIFHWSLFTYTKGPGDYSWE